MDSTSRTLGSHAFLALIGGALLCAGCGLFEPRDPEPPSQSGFNFPPQTDHSIVVANLQNAVALKNTENYIRCFVDPVGFSRPFVFVPSADAAAQYGAVLGSWNLSAENDYFRNLVAKSPPNGFANLLLTQKALTQSADSVQYDFDYVLTFEHSEADFPSMARGNLRFTIIRNSSNFWAIAHWVDYNTTTDASWSLFKGKFGN